MTLDVTLRDRLGSFDLDVHFTAPDGVTVLFGKSGSGKTSVINAIAGLTQPNFAQVTLDGTRLCDTETRHRVPANKRGLGYVFQDARLFPHMNVARNLDYGRRFARVGAALPDRDQVIELLSLSHLLTRRPKDLSGGEKQRVAIGRALLSGPRMLLADEPLAALDAARKAEILRYFERLRDELSIPILYVSHSAAEVARLATTIVVLENGRVLRSGPAAEVMADPQITPLGASAAGAILEARITAHHADGLTELSAGGHPVYLPRTNGALGESLRVYVAAGDVMLSLEKPRDISALNVLPVEILDIRIGDGPGALVQLGLGANRLLSRVTRRSVEALALAPGNRVFAVLKAVSVARDGVAGQG